MLISFLMQISFRDKEFESEMREVRLRVGFMCRMRREPR
jgi:hypothetical protein